MSKFCAAPFKTAVVDRDGAMLPCCEYMPVGPRDSLTKIDNIKRWWNIELEDLRNDMRQGKENSGCHHCVAKESNLNYQSHRQSVNSNYSKLDSNVTLDAIEIRVSNYCNLKCIMCGSYASSSIAEEYRKHEAEYHSIGMVGAWEPTTRWWDDQASLDNLKNILTTVSRVSFAGGEPLLVPEVIDILNSLDSAQLREIKIITNLTRLSDKFLKSIEKFKRVDIQVSLEGVGRHNDYIRFGSDWNILENNIKKLLSLPNITLSINHVLQHTSIFALPLLMAFAKEHSIKLSLSEVYQESYPSPGVLTIDSVDPIHVTHFINWLNGYNGIYKPQLTKWVASYKFNSDLHQKFNDYVTMLDRIRGNSFANTFLINI